MFLHCYRQAYRYLECFFIATDRPTGILNVSSLLQTDLPVSYGNSLYCMLFISAYAIVYCIFLYVGISFSFDATIIWLIKLNITDDVCVK